MDAPMRRMRISTMLGVLLICVGTAQACKPLPIRGSYTEEGLLLPEYAESDYVFYGEVVGEGQVKVDSRYGSKIVTEYLVTTIRIKVLESATGRTVPGAVHDVYKYGIGGSSCQNVWYESVTNKEYPVGSKITVIAPELAVGSWAFVHRVVPINIFHWYAVR